MGKISTSDRQVLRELGFQIAEAAANPVNNERREHCLQVESLQNQKPTVFIYQEPWSELGGNSELDLLCKGEFCRKIESNMRRTLYKWRNYPGDMTISAISLQPYFINDSGFGISEDVDIVATDSENDVVSRHFNIQIKDEDDIRKIQEPKITHDSRKTEEYYQMRCEIFDGVLEVKKIGVDTFWFAPWDSLVSWTGLQEILMDMVLRPEYVHKLIGRLVDCWIKRLEQYEQQGLLISPLKELTVSGAAQIFSEVSPEMHREFALQHEAEFLNRFGRIYYGCCEPLHNMVDICAECLPNLYKISMSPWVNFPVAVKNVRNRFVFAWKPNPALLAYEKWDPGAVRSDIREKLKMAADGGCFVEIHLKDISTVCHEPWRLPEWEKIAKEEVSRIFN